MNLRVHAAIHNVIHYDYFDKFQPDKELGINH